MARKITGLLILAAVFLWSWGPPAWCQSPDAKEFQALNKRAIKLYKAGRYQEALPLVQRLLQTCKQTLGPGHPSTAATLHNLAELHRAMGAPDKALPLYQQALKITEKSLGPEHPKTIIVLDNLASLHKEMGAYDQALPLYQKVLKIRKKTLGPEHLNTANSLNKLALLYKKMGSLDKALPLYQQVLTIFEKKRGPQHPQTATILHNLAELHRVRFAYEQALPLHQRALEVREKALGPEHQDTALSLHNLALLYQDMGVFDKALSLYQKAVKINEKTLGPNHPKTAHCLNNLARLYQTMGAYGQALPIQKRALQIREEALGPNHPDTAISLNNLAGLYQSMGSFEKALPPFQRALNIREEVLGPNHPDTASSLNNLAGLYQGMGSREKALPLFQRALKIREEVLGPNHPNTAISLSSLANLYRAMGSYEKALPLFQQALKIREEGLGPNHPHTANNLNNLAGLYQVMGSYEKALPLFQRALKIREEVMGPNHPQTANSLNNVAFLYQEMGSYEKALPLFQRALKISEKALGTEHPGTILVLDNLGGFFLDRKDYQTAEAYFRRTKFIPGLAELSLAQGQPKKALKLLQRRAPTWRDTPIYLVQYYTQQGLALADLERPGESAQAFLKAVQGVEELRQRVAGEKAGFFRGSLGGGYVRPYRGLVGALAEMALREEKLPDDLGEYGPGPGNAAFYFAEATKGRVLLESLAAAARKTSRVELPEELRRREESLLNQMTALKDQWEKALQGGELAVKEAQQKKARLVSEQRTLVRELRHKFPVYAALHYPEPLPAPELPLKPQEVLLEYALGDKASYILMVRQSGVNKIIRLPLGREALEEKIKSFMAPLLDVELSAFSIGQGKELGDLLLKEALAQVQEGERLIIVPDGLLGLLPFEALVLQPGQDLADSTYVGDKYSLSYYQSAAVLALQRRLRAAEPSRQFFALGNPVFSEKDRRYVRFKHRGAAPQTPVKAPEHYAFRALATHRDWGKTRQGDRGRKELTFPPLPETETKVQTIARTLGVKEKPPDVLLNIQANETYLRQSPLGDYRYLHFATHADLPGTVQGIKEPFILLGQVENKKGDDGFLTLSEVLGLKLKADLVVLSACNTGRGRMMAGEGVANFARAFQHAGAQSVLVSLWPLASKEAVTYMTAFYSHLKAGKSRAAALRQARQEIKAQHPHPFFWAVFILHGEG